MSPLTKLLLASVGAIYLLKLAGLASRERPQTAAGIAAFLFAWPGVFPGLFRERHAPKIIETQPFLAAWARMLLGAAAIVLLAIFAPQVPSAVLGWAGIAGFLLAIHFGLGDLLPPLLRGVGFSAPPLFRCPWAATSLADFWSNRWNLAFVEMNRRWFLRPACRWFGASGARFALFAVSGALHELAISYPAGAGWGLPFAYFALQGVLVQIEERFGIAGRLWTWFWVLAPLLLVFHAPFRHTLIVPFYLWLHAVIASHTPGWYLSLGLYAAALGQLTTMAAGLQAPARLGWKDDLAKLQPFNRKIFTVYAFYVVFSIVSFAVLTWRLHDRFLAGDQTARWLAGFIAVFWTLRIVIDFWYGHRDWPRGNAFITGHALLTSLFSALAIVYWWAAIAPRG